MIKAYTNSHPIFYSQEDHFFCSRCGQITLATIRFRSILEFALLLKQRELPLAWPGAQAYFTSSTEYPIRPRYPSEEMAFLIITVYKGMRMGITDQKPFAQSEDPLSSSALPPRPPPPHGLHIPEEE
jgi:hypothetical protein